MLPEKKDIIQVQKKYRCDELSERIQFIAKKINHQCEHLSSDARIKQSLQEMIVTCETALVELYNQQQTYDRALQQRKESLISKILKR